LLDADQILRHILQSDVSQVLIILNLVEDRAPDWHLSRTMGGATLVPGDDVAHPGSWERTLISLRKSSKRRNFCLQGGRNRALSVSVYAVAGGTIVPENLGSVQRKTCALIRSSGWLNVLVRQESLATCEP
jgi:hypothetical protein